MGCVEIRFYLDPETREAHILNHGVTEDEVEQVFESRSTEDRLSRGETRMLVGATNAGRCLRVVYVPDPEPDSVFVLTAYELRGKPLAAFRRRQRRRSG
jgi:hypothetical protein